MTCASGTATAKCRDRRTRPDEAIGAESCHVDEYARRFSHVEPNTPPTARFTPNAPARALAVASTHSLCGLVLRSPAASASHGHGTFGAGTIIRVRRGRPSLPQNRSSGSREPREMGRYRRSPRRHVSVILRKMEALHGSHHRPTEYQAHPLGTPRCVPAE